MNDRTGEADQGYVRCQWCGKRSGPHAQTGGTATCPHCGREVDVAANRAAPPGQETTTLYCPACGHAQQVPADADQTVTCEACGASARSGDWR